MKRILGKDIRKVFLMIFCVGFILTSYIIDNNNQIIAKELSKVEETKIEEKVEPTLQEVVPLQTTIDSQPHSTITGNSIQISNVLDSPLMKDTTGENYYLNHNEQGDYDGRGVPYIDYRTNFYTRKTLIYAHSMTDGNGPFQILQSYHNNKDFYDKNRYITINYEGYTYTYEIFSVYVSTADSENSEGLEYFHNVYYDNNSWAETIQKYKNNSEYETGVTVNSNDKILILQTCSMDLNYLEHYYRYNLLVMGKLV